MNTFPLNAILLEVLCSIYDSQYVLKKNAQHGILLVHSIYGEAFSSFTLLASVSNLSCNFSATFSKAAIKIFYIVYMYCDKYKICIMDIL